MPITIRFRGTAEDLNQCRRSARSPSAIIGVECRVHRPSGHSKGICTNADEVHGIRLLTSRQNFSRIQICSTAVSFRRVDQEHSLPGPHRSAVSFSPQLDATHPLLDRNCCFDAGTFSSSSHLVLRSSDPTSRANCPNMHAASGEKVEFCSTSSSLSYNRSRRSPRRNAR